MYMKIWILSSDSESFSTKALSQSLLKLRHEVDVVDPLGISTTLKDGSMALKNIFGERLSPPDLILPRLGWRSRDFGLNLTLSLESQGIPAMNSGMSILRTSHKLQSLFELRKNNIPVPDLHFQFSQNSEPLPFFDSERTIFKHYFGSQGFGTTWSESAGQSKSLVDLMRNSQTPFFIQKYLSPQCYKDIRCFFINDELIASFQRTSSPHDIRSNLNQGGHHEKYNVGDEIKKIAFKAHQTFNLKYSAVDILAGPNDIRVLEVNPSPGLKGLSEIYGVPRIDEFAASLVSAR